MINNQWFILRRPFDPLGMEVLYNRVGGFKAGVEVLFAVAVDGEFALVLGLVAVLVGFLHGEGLDGVVAIAFVVEFDADEFGGSGA